MGRVDTKASILFGFSLAVLTGGIGLLAKSHVDAVGIMPAMAAIALIGSALMLLGAAIRPSLGGNHGFVRYAAAESAHALAEDLHNIDTDSAEYRAQQLWWLSRAVQRKYRRVRLAVDLLMGGLGCAVVAGLVTAIF